MRRLHRRPIAFLGKTLILDSSPLFTASPVSFQMFTALSLMAQMRNWNRPALSARPLTRHTSRNSAPSQGLSHELLSSAEARAGQNPHQAEELRRAARAYLSVVR